MVNCIVSRRVVKLFGVVLTHLWASISKTSPTKKIKRYLGTYRTGGMSCVKLHAGPCSMMCIGATPITCAEVLNSHPPCVSERSWTVDLTGQPPPNLTASVQLLFSSLGGEGQQRWPHGHQQASEIEPQPPANPRDPARISFPAARSPVIQPQPHPTLTLCKESNNWIVSTFHSLSLTGSLALS